MAAVRLTRLQLTDFRNYRDLALCLDGFHAVFTGENGAGKTNLLEAVSLLSPGRGLRRAAYADLAARNQDREAGRDACRDTRQGFSVFAEIDGMNGRARIGTAVGGAGNDGRRLRIDGAPVRSYDALLNHLRLTWLTPAMDGLFTGGGAGRRRFLDRQVLAIDPGHGRRVADFERVMRGRNRLLAGERADPVWLDGIEAQMAPLGVAIAHARRELVAMLTQLIDGEDAPEAGAFPQAGLVLDDFLSDLAGVAKVEQEEEFAERLKAMRRRDASAGRTLTGPHRSDLAVRHRAKNIDAAHCSTGEQKALLVGLVLAGARLTATVTGSAPLMLLDEIAAHLDARRRAALFGLVDALEAQALMTGTDRALFAALAGKARFFNVTAGAVTVEEQGRLRHA